MNLWNNSVCSQGGEVFEVKALIKVSEVFLNGILQLPWLSFLSRESIYVTASIYVKKFHDFVAVWRWARRSAKGLAVMQFEIKDA